MARGMKSARSLSAIGISLFTVHLAACEGTVEPAQGSGSGGQAPRGGSGGSDGDGGDGQPGAGGTSVGMAGSGNDAGASSGGTNAGGAPADGGEPGEVGGSGGDLGIGGTTTGEGGAAGSNDLTYCLYNQDVAPSPAGGAGGEGGQAAAEAPNITLRTDPFLGQYLADGTGKTLYIYGKDLTGDCENVPVSGCTSSTCLSAWPPFYVTERVLSAGLDPARFGSAEGPTGPIITYLGWPLYTYPADTDPGMIKGQGKQGLWFTAEVELPDIIPMRAVDATVNHLATSLGYALYVHALDTLGTSDAPPVSACSGACAARHVPLIANTISAASSIEASDLGLFLRQDGELQLAYKGAPLYLDAETPRPGSLVDPIPEQWAVALK